MKRLLLTLPVFSFAALLPSVDAAAIMLDFGPTTVVTADAANSPWHSVAPSGGTTWNKVSNTGNADYTAVADISAGGLSFADGTTATGIAVNLGVASGTNVNLATQPTRNSALAGNLNSGIYAGTSVGRDGVFAGSQVATGVQVTGLAAGTYDIYVTARNTSFGGAYKQIGYAGVGTVGDFDYATYTTQTLSYTNATAPSTWVAGETYMKFTITVAEGQGLNIAVMGESSGNPDRGIINSIQIVSVPEVSSALLGGLAFGAVAIRRRRA